MLTSEKQQLNQLLTRLARELDIPDSVYEDATIKYEDIGSWLAANDSALKEYAPLIYPQGSFLLGTVVRPVSQEDEFDIDLVCHLDLEKEQTTQKNLRPIVGDRLRKQDELARILEPLGRCWRLNYPGQGDKLHFHMDVLPAISNREHPPTGILLSDRELTRWQKSNPKAYASWFHERMKIVLMEMKAALAKSIQVDVEEVPEWQVKTPLQIAVQILKRHRDIYFLDHPENKPASIILTTLAALAYDNQEDVFDALGVITRHFADGIEKRNGQWWVANPVDEDENFADKWNQDPKRRELFESWLLKLQQDFRSIGQQPLYKSANLLESSLGRDAVAKVAADLGLRASASLSVQEMPGNGIPALGSTRHGQSPMWPMNMSYKAQVTGSVHHMASYKKLWDLTDRPQWKNLRLKFKVWTNTKRPFEVKWQVVNTGQEAAAAGQLRGGFYESSQTNDSVRWETTLYKGTHWIEAFIIRDGVCVARSGRKMVRIR